MAPFDTEGPLWDAVQALLDEGNNVDEIAEMVQDIEDAYKAEKAAILQAVEEDTGSVDWQAHTESRLLQLEIVLSTVQINLKKLTERFDAHATHGYQNPVYPGGFSSIPWKAADSTRPMNTCACRVENGGSGVCNCVMNDQVRH